MAKTTQGKRGLKGGRGAVGAVGAIGAAGARGARGPAGPTGPRMKSAEVLALVDDQFVQIRKQLDMQLLRTAQLQAQLDKIQRNTTEACSALEILHPLVKALVKKG